jgi:hypothetical protein
MARSKRIKKEVIGAVVVLVILLVGVAVYFGTKPKTVATKTTATQTPTPSPGQAGNPGDAAKQQQAQNQTQTPVVPTPQSASSAASIAAFSINPPDPSAPGQIHPVSTVYGANNASCSLKLTSPKGDQNQNLTGQAVWAGSYYDCGFGTITGVTESGTWHATLTVQPTSGASTSASTTFTI